MSTSGTSGRSVRGVVAPMMAIILAFLVLTFLLEDKPADISQVEGLRGFVTVQIASQAIAGAICGALFAGLFGRERVFGLMLSVLGGFFVTLLAGALGGALQSLPDILTNGLAVQDGLNVVVGALLIVLASAGRPMVGLAWLVLILLTHVLAARQRRSDKRL